MMKACVAEAIGPDAKFEIKDIPKPTPGPEEVLLAVKASSLNPIDNLFLRYDLGLNPSLPSAVLHGDVAGVVVAAGSNVTKFKVGDEVFGCPAGFIGTQGALAEFMTADARSLALKPASLSFGDAAALPLVVLTAWESLVDGIKVVEGEHVLVHSGTGGVGHVAIQIAKAKKAVVSATVSNDKSAEIARGFGADNIINYKTEEVDDYVKRLSPGGFDAVVDTVGGANTPKSFQAVRVDGRVSVFFTGPSTSIVDLLQAFVKRAIVYSQNMSVPIVTGEGREHHGEIMAEIAALVENGQLTPLVDATRFPFTKVNEAHAYYEAAKHRGKIVLENDL